MNDDDTDAELALQRDSGKPDKPPPSAAPPEEPTQRSAANRPLAINKVVLGVVAVIAVIGLIALLVITYNKQKVGKSDNPTAQKAALTLLETVPVKGWAPKTGYSRDQFGSPWTDNVNVEFGHNGCDTRNDILRRDLSDVTTRNCVVLSGVLHDPYTGKDVQFNREEGTDVLVQVDHVVPLLDAWETGAQQWDQAKRTEFANDPLDLLAVSGKANRKKKDGDVAKWLPSNPDFRCDYVTRVVKVKAKYGLWMIQAEHDEASRILTKCSSQALPSSGVLPSVGTLYPSSSAKSK